MTELTRDAAIEPDRRHDDIRYGLERECKQPKPDNAWELGKQVCLAFLRCTALDRSDWAAAELARSGLPLEPI